MATDNDRLDSKLLLRRYFLDKYHADGSANVFDCCQGSGVIWSERRRTHSVKSYWGVDQKPKKGRLKIDSVRVLGQPGWPFDVIDVDTYGLPWKHWMALLANLDHPATVFLTIGRIGVGLMANDRVMLNSVGLVDIRVPNGFMNKIDQFSTSYLLSKSCDYGINAVEAVESSPGRTARYIGVRLEPKKV